MLLSRRLFVQSLTALSAMATPRVCHKLLFVVNEVAEYQGLPRGTVESYEVSGSKRLISRRALSLAATMPKSLALSPDGTFLIIAAHGGGIYNALPVSPTGEIGEVSQVIKTIGSSVHPVHQTTSHPHSLAFHPSGKFLLATDLGADRITVFSVSNGRIAPASSVSTPPGSGPGKLRMDQSGSNVTVWHELKPSVAYYQFDAHSGRLT